jgi:hypothetical protein
MLKSNKKVDYFQSSYRYTIPENKWYFTNPVQSISYFYHAKMLSAKENKISWNKQSFIYNKQNIAPATFLLKAYLDQSSVDYPEIINLGEFILNSVPIDRVLTSTAPDTQEARHNLKLVFMCLLRGYCFTDKKEEFLTLEKLMSKYNLKLTSAEKKYIDIIRPK